MGKMVAYTSDLHGNMVQYQKLVDYANKERIDTIIIGGDIAPKGFFRENFISGQREFLQALPGFFQQQQARVFIMMGNDDCAANMDVLLAAESEKFQLIHGKKLPVGNGFDILGYSFVPITPFGIKDWEKYDFSNPLQAYKQKYRELKDSNSKLDGIKSSQEGWKEFSFTPEMEKKDSIQKDLRKLPFSGDVSKTLIVFHSPPYDSLLDLTLGARHFGSMAIRDFIEKKKPYLTLHGHIHETVHVSGQFSQKIGDTLCISSGNSDRGSDLALIVFDIENPSDAKRLII